MTDQERETRTYRHRDALRVAGAGGGIGSAAIGAYLLTQVSGLTGLIQDQRINRPALDQRFRWQFLMQPRKDLWPVLNEMHLMTLSDQNPRQLSASSSTTSNDHKHLRPPVRPSIMNEPG